MCSFAEAKRAKLHYGCEGSPARIPRVDKRDLRRSARDGHRVGGPPPASVLETCFLGDEDQLCVSGARERLGVLRVDFQS